MTIELDTFRAGFPRYKDCSDDTLGFWAELACCMVCVPKTCPALGARMPMLMLDHLLTVNNVQCEAVVDPDAPADVSDCECDDEMLTSVLSGGARISSVSMEGYSVSFDNTGTNQVVGTLVGNSTWYAYLSTTESGRLLATLQKRMAGGGIVVRGGIGMGHGAYAEPVGGHLFGHGIY